MPQQIGASNRVQLALASLRAIESRERARTDFSRLPTADEIMGADPYRVAALGGDRFAGILRGMDALVLLDARGRELARMAAPRGPTGLAVAGDAIAVSGEYGGEIARYRRDGDSLIAEGRQRVPGAVALRDVALGEDGVAYAVDEHQDALFVVPRDATEGTTSFPVCAAPVRLVKSGSWLALSCIVDHLVQLWPIGADGPSELTRFAIEHDGPAWGLALSAHDDGTATIAIGAVENAPLDRSGGFFGNVDSFLFLYDVDGHIARPTRSVNLSELGVITPKALAWRGDALWVTGYGGERAIVLSRLPGFAPLQPRPLPPGSNDIALNADGAALIANPLLDAWVSFDAGGSELVEVEGPRPAAHASEVHLGEVLFFSYLMAPENTSDGSLSRFSCETCHFEGYVDGRTHHTGRGDVRATTKPLVSLFSNRPHFTRALDPDLTQVSHAEFRVAGAGNDRDPWFRLDVASRPWLARIVGERATLEPLELRTALMRFLMAFNHRPNPAALDKPRFEEREQRGAAIFRDVCARCHAPRLVTDDPASEVPFEGWEAMVLDRRGPITWAKSGYEKTGIEPYVHPKGARTTALRRLYKKRPYFTNGSARTLAEVLDRASLAGDRFFHAGGGGAPLAPEAKRDLLAFLRLL